MKRDADVAVPPGAAVAAETRSLPSLRRRSFAWAPYRLVEPVVAAIAIVLAYPI